jgi:hypothetical protein
MKIVQEIFEKEHYIDQIISQKELTLLQEFMVLSFPCVVDGKKVNLGIKVDMFEDDE